ncbi:MAG: FHA domain-containing protein [Eubacteriales bacterium]
MGKRKLNFLIAILSLAFTIISYLYKDGELGLILTGVGAIFFIVFIIACLKKDEEEKTIEISHEIPINTQITELALLNEEDTPISFWQMYGKSSLIIGLDTGENQVDVNLLNTTYASTIDVEHAMLNYSGGNWYIEDNNSKNGISVIKSDGKKYRLNNEKPCLVEKGDIIYVSMTKLKLC